jgi:hypothetical protein
MGDVSLSISPKTLKREFYQSMLRICCTLSSFLMIVHSGGFDKPNILRSSASSIYTDSTESPGVSVSVFVRACDLLKPSLRPSGFDRHGYYHELFLRGKAFLSTSIKRMKIKGKGARKPSAPESEPDFYAMPFLPPCNDDVVKGGPPHPSALSRSTLPTLSTPSVTAASWMSHLPVAPVDPHIASPRYIFSSNLPCLLQMKQRTNGRNFDQPSSQDYANRSMWVPSPVLVPLLSQHHLPRAAVDPHVLDQPPRYSNPSSELGPLLHSKPSGDGRAFDTTTARGSNLSHLSLLLAVKHDLEYRHLLQQQRYRSAFYDESYQRRTLPADDPVPLVLQSPHQSKKPE